MKTVKFDIVGNKINVSLDLGLTSMRRFGVRMIGDAHFSFSNGTKKRGVMKIEVDSKSDKSLPFEL